MNPASKPLPRLIDLERDIVAQAREWGRQRLQEELQKLADETGEVFPPKAAQAPKVKVAKRVRKNRADR